MHALKAALFWLVRWVVTIMLLVMTSALLAQIIFRYFFQQPLVWSEELALVLMIWITYLGSALLLASHEHISIDFLVELLPQAGQRWLAVAVAMLMILFNVALTYGAWLVAKATARSTSPGLGISEAWHYAGPVLGGALLVLVSADELVKRIRDLRTHALP